MKILSFYIAKRFLVSIFIVFATFAVVAVLVDGIELLRRTQSKDVPILTVLHMMVLKFPEIIIVAMPFILLIAATITYTSLTRSSELIVIRSSGVSIWKILLPALLVSFLLGTIMVVGLNPLFTEMKKKYELLEARYIHGKKDMVVLDDKEQWLKEKNEEAVIPSETIIYAKKIGVNSKGEGSSLLNAIFYIYYHDYRNGNTNPPKFSLRIDADQARLLEEGLWQLDNAKLITSNGDSFDYEELFLPTKLKKDNITQKFVIPESVSFWQLPRFIKSLEESGYPTLSHRLHYYNLLITPFFYMAMIFVAAVFSMRPPRQAKTGFMITAAIFSGFIVFFLTELIHAIGLSGTIPPILASILPMIIVILTSIGMLIQLEDG